MTRFPIAVLAILALTGVWNPGPAASADLSRQAQLAARGGELAIPAEKRPEAPSIAIPTASFGDGSVFDLGRERDNVVVLYFMAAWCATCIPEARALAALHEAYAGKGVRILVLDVDQNETEADLARFRERAGKGSHLWAFDREFRVALPYRVRALDTTIVIDRQGRVAYGDAYPTPYEDLAAVAEALLQ